MTSSSSSRRRRARARVGQLGQRALEQRARLALAPERVVQAGHPRGRPGAQRVLVRRGIASMVASSVRRASSRRPAAAERGGERHEHLEAPRVAFVGQQVERGTRTTAPPSRGRAAPRPGRRWRAWRSPDSSPGAEERSTWSAIATTGAPRSRSAAAARPWAARRQPPPCDLVDGAPHERMAEDEAQRGVGVPAAARTPAGRRAPSVQHGVPGPRRPRPGRSRTARRPRRRPPAGRAAPRSTRPARSGSRRSRPAAPRRRGRRCSTGGRLGRSRSARAAPGRRGCRRSRVTTSSRRSGAHAARDQLVCTRSAGEWLRGQQNGSGRPGGRGPPRLPARGRAAPAGRPAPRAPGPVAAAASGVPRARWSRASAQCRSSRTSVSGRRAASRPSSSRSARCVR